MHIPRLLPSAAAALSVLALRLVAGPLEDYVGAPDASFNWKRNEQKPLPGATLSHLELVSQTWQGQFWSHHILVVRPDKLTHPDIALLFVTGGGYGAPDDKEAERRFNETLGRMLGTPHKPHRAADSAENEREPKPAPPTKGR